MSLVYKGESRVYVTSINCCVLQKVSMNFVYIIVRIVVTNIKRVQESRKGINGKINR